MIRGCGERVAGGVYAEVGLSEHGLPVEYCVVDPPHPVDMNLLGLSYIGVKMIQLDGVWHILDVVGRSAYPNVQDFIQEGARFGFSRRLSKTLDFSKLTPQSRLIMIHDRAYVGNMQPFADTGGWMCPKAISTHSEAESHCAGVWMRDVEPVGQHDIGGDAIYARRMPSFNYHVIKPLPESVDREYRPAVFMSLPITRIAVVRAPDGSHIDAMRRAAKARVPSVAVNE